MIKKLNFHDKSMSFKMICLWKFHWYQCVAFCELVWRHGVNFLILDLLNRYRQNTAKSGLCFRSLTPYIYPITQHKLPIGKYDYLRSSFVCLTCLPSSLVCVTMFLITCVTVLFLWLVCPTPYSTQLQYNVIILSVNYQLGMHYRSYSVKVYSIL